MTCLYRDGHRWKIVLDTDEILEADYVVAGAAHGSPGVAQFCGGVGQAGTYHLNAILFVNLPPIDEDFVLRYLIAGTFILQGQHGLMFAPILLPTPMEPGVAALYFPDEENWNHLASWPSGVQNGSQRPLSEWDEVIAAGRFSGDDERCAAIVNQACRYLPWLREYLGDGYRARFVIRIVFSPRVDGVANGRDRPTHALLTPVPITPDSSVIAASSPKWTTVELAALSALQQMLTYFGEEPLETDFLHGFGPYRLNVFAISKYHHLRGMAATPQRKAEYLSDRGFPLRMAG